MQWSDSSSKKRKRGLVAAHPCHKKHDKDGAPISVEVASPKRSRAGEQGYILLAVLFLAVMVLIALAVAAPKVAADIERDREVELMHRGMQYRRAIQLYYRKFGAYPPNMEALEKSGEIRFLRKRYLDPVTGKDEWHLIHFGENKLPTVMGFFGQPMGGIGGSTLAGTGPGGVGQSLGAGLTPSNFGGGIGGQTGGSSFGGSSFGNNSIGGSSFGSNSIGGNSIGSNSTVNTGGSDPNAGGTSSNGTNSSGTNQGTGSSDPNASGSNGSASSSFMSGSNSTGQTFGGGGIIGIESTSPKATILEYKKKKHFNEWEFVYDPASERKQVSGNLGTIGQPAGAAGNSPTVNSPSLNGGNPNSPNGGDPNSPNGGQPSNPNQPIFSPNGNLPAPQTEPGPQ